MLLLATLALLGVAAAGRRVPAVLSATMPICAVCLLASVAGLLRGGEAASLTLPIGFPGQPSVFAIDRVSLAFVPAAAIAGAAATIIVPAAQGARMAALIASVLLALCAGDSSLLVIGAALAVLAGSRPGWAVVVALTVAASLAGLLSHSGALLQASLPAMRSAAVAGAGRGWEVLLVLVPVMMLVRVAGFGGGGTLLPVLGSFLLVRVLFDLNGPSAPFAWGLAVTAAGLAGAVERGLRAVRAASLDAVGVGLSGLGGFVAVAGFGVALAARSADLPAIASASLAAALLMVLLLAAAVPLALIAIGSIAEQAGSRRFGALGGLSQPMPLTLLGLSVALATIVGVPPLAGFAPVWLVAQSLLSAQRFGGIATPVVLALALASLGLAVGLGLVASFRLLAIVFGGRPRTPRGAAAAEARPAMLRAMGVLGGVLLLIAAMPGMLLRFFDPAVGALTGTTLAARAGPWSVRAVAGGAVFPPLAVLVLVAGPAALAVVIGRRLGLRAGGEMPVWNGGAGPPPEWLPFGEPRAQASAPGLARPALSALGLVVGTLPGEGVRPWSDRASGEFWPARIAWAARLSRRAARRMAGLEPMLLEAGPGLLVLLLVAVLAASVMLAGGRLG